MKNKMTTYGFEPQMGGKARGIGFEKELAPTVAATRVGGALIIKSDMQNTTGTLSPGAHAGSYNGQDAYNDMLVVRDGIRNRKWAVSATETFGKDGNAELHARSTSDPHRGGGVKKI